MNPIAFPRFQRAFALACLALALVAGAGPRPASAQTSLPVFPTIPIWSYAGVRCTTCGPDTIVDRARTVTVRFRRDRRAEARRDFGGYRIYRVVNTPDSTRMMLIRRFSTNRGSDLTWGMSRVDTTTLEFKIGTTVVHDSIVTFVDPDSNGNYVKVCRVVDNVGRCLSRGDSIMVLQAPPGPHDGFATYYSITYEARNPPDVGTYEDLYVARPDTLDNYARCGTVGDPNTCPIINMNMKLLNVTGPVYPTRGPVADLEEVHVVPNPFRGAEVWDSPGGGEVHFVNLPAKSRIKIFTAAGDLVKEIEHSDDVRDFERWNLRNGKDQPIASGIYLYRVEAGTFTFQNRFVVIR